MSQADELLNSVSESGISTYTAGHDTEPHIVVGEDRFITVPEELKRIAVQYDHDVETVHFDCPRYWDGHDLSWMKIYINYMRSDKVIGSFAAESPIIDEYDESLVHFDWVISRNVTEADGKISFLVCAKFVDGEGNETVHWNSELCTDMYVSEGLEGVGTVPDSYPDVITHLLVRMDYIEEIATPESMKEYVDRFLTDSPELRELVYDYLELNPITTPEEMMGYVRQYMEEHPPLFVIGPEKPGVACLWFNTSKSGSTDTQTIKLLADNPDAAVYAEVEGDSTTINDYTIL